MPINFSHLLIDTMPASVPPKLELPAWLAGDALEYVRTLRGSYD